MISRAAGMAGLMAALVSSGCALRNPSESGSGERPDKVPMRFHIGANEPQPGLEMVRDEYGRPLFIDPQPVLTEIDVADATGLIGAERSMLILRLTLSGAARLERVTEQNVGRRLAVFIDDRLVVSGIMARPVTEGELAIDAGLKRKLVERVLRGYAAPRDGAP